MLKLMTGIFLKYSWLIGWCGCTGSLSWHAGFSSCSAAGRILVPRPGIKPMSPALAGRFLTMGPLGKSRCLAFLNANSQLYVLAPLRSGFLTEGESCAESQCPPQGNHKHSNHNDNLSPLSQGFSITPLFIYKEGVFPGVPCLSQWSLFQTRHQLVKIHQKLPGSTQGLY